MKSGIGGGHHLASVFVLLALTFAAACSSTEERRGPSSNKNESTVDTLAEEGRGEIECDLSTADHDAHKDGELQCALDEDCDEGWACVSPPGLCVKKSDLDIDGGDGEVAAETVLEPGDCANGNPTTVGSSDVESCFVPETSFPMGSPDGECEVNGGVCPYEKPQHEVVTLEFYMDRFEVTNSQFKVFSIQNPEWAPGAGGAPGASCDEYYLFDWGDDGVFAPEDAEKPVVWVCWHAGRAFCEWAGKALPTEAEWELAAKGGTHRSYPWGDDTPTCERAAFEECPQIVDVGSFEEGQSPYGIHDLAGNAAEWIADWYDASYYCDPDESGPPCHEPATGWVQPQGPAQGIDKVVRGGGAFSSPFWLRAAARGHHEPEQTRPDVGFRCVYHE